MNATNPARAATLALALALALAAAAQAARAAEPPIEVPLSAPGQPVELVVHVISGSIEVEAGETGRVVVEVVPREAAAARPERRKDGMYRIPNVSGGVTVEELGNRVEVHVRATQRATDLRIRVPVRTSVKASSTNAGTVRVRGVDGEHELRNVNGAIVAEDVSGSVVASTTNGPVRVAFTRVEPDRVMSFATWNGNVDVTFPAGLAADVRMESERGEILSDFEMEIAPPEPAERRRDDKGRFRVEVRRAVRGAIGGGGALMEFRTYQGDILIRRR